MMTIRNYKTKMDKKSARLNGRTTTRPDPPILYAIQFCLSPSKQKANFLLVCRCFCDSYFLFMYIFEPELANERQVLGNLLVPKQGVLDCG